MDNIAFNLIRLNYKINVMNTFIINNKIKGAVLGVVLVMLFFILSVGQLTYAQTTSDATTIAALQKQIELLLSEMQSLKAEVATLKSELVATPSSPSTSLISPSVSENSVVSTVNQSSTIPTFDHSFARGTRGEDVRALQEYLAQDPNIYPEGLVTGYFGPNTESAVSRWQKKYGIDSTGYIGPLTMAKFQELKQGQPQQQLQSQIPSQDRTNRNACPEMPSVVSCPAGQEKRMTYQSAACGAYFTCVSVGSMATSTVVSATTTSIISSTTIRVIPNTPPSGQREQIWNSLGLRSWVREDADSGRIENLKQACQNVQPSANIWMMSAGSYGSTDFGMPSPDRCRLAATCNASQYFNGSSCVNSSGVNYYNTSTISTNSNWISHIWHFQNGSNQQSYILNRTDIEYMDFITSVDNQCRFINQSIFHWKPGAGNDAATNWQNFGIPDCSGAAIVNSTSTVINTTSSSWTGTTPPAGQKEQIWNMLGLKSWIRNDVDPARIEQVKSACANVRTDSNVWLSGAGDSTSLNFGFPDPNKCSQASACSSTQYFNGTSCSTNNGYGGSTYCASNQYWNGSSCVMSGSSSSSSYMSCDWTSQYLKMSNNSCQPRSNCADASNPEYNTSECQGVRSSNYNGGYGSGTTASCPSGQYWYSYSGGGGYCTSSAQGAQTCPSGQVWYTPPSGGSGYCQSTSWATCSSGYYWNGSSCVSSGSSCSSGQYWNGSMCVSSGSYSTDPATGCAQAGGSWNGSMCVMPTSSLNSQANYLASIRFALENLQELLNKLFLR